MKPMHPKEPHLIPCNMAEWRTLFKPGALKIHLTWATADQITDVLPLKWWQKLGRRLWG